VKVRLVELDRKARSEGRGFMRRLKAYSEEDFPAYHHMSAQCLRDNASRFCQDIAVTNAVAVRREALATIEDTRNEGTDDDNGLLVRDEDSSVDTAEVEDAEQIADGVTTDSRDEFQPMEEKSEQKDEPLNAKYREVMGKINKSTKRRMEERTP
jgi:hypothetical protein